MVTNGLYVRLEAKPGKEQEVETFLRDALPIVQGEDGTVAWFAIRMGATTFGIFDCFKDQAGRQAHLSGKVAAALKQRADELFANPPRIERLDVLAAKLPQAFKPATPLQEERIPMQVGSELRIRNTGEIVVDNPEVELAHDPAAADATLAYRFNPKLGEHVVRLVTPVADHRHMATHQRGD